MMIDTLTQSVFKRIYYTHIYNLKCSSNRKISKNKLNVLHNLLYQKSDVNINTLAVGHQLTSNLHYSLFLLPTIFHTHNILYKITLTHCLLYIIFSIYLIMLRMSTTSTFSNKHLYFLQVS